MQIRGNEFNTLSLFQIEEQSGVLLGQVDVSHPNNNIKVRDERRRRATVDFKRRDPIMRESSEDGNRWESL